MTDRNRPSRAVDDLHSLARDLASQVSDVEARRAAFRAINAGRRPSKHRLWVVGLATIGVLVVSNVALAAASNSAAPGDLLYSLDRGYEWVADRFAPHDRSTERIEEAEDLIAEGEPALAVALLSEALASLGGEDALAAAAATAEASNSLGNGSNNSKVRAAVEELVDATKDISEAAHLGDQTALHAAIDTVHERANDVAEAAQEQGGSLNSNFGSSTGTGSQSDPSVTAPGQIKEGESGTTPTAQPSGNGQGQGLGQGQAKQKSKEG